jgi:hypothetical protein
MIVVLVLGGLLLGAAGPGLGQDERRAKDIIDAYRVWKLTDVLDLSDDEMAAFFSRVRRVGEAEEEHRQAEREAVGEIDSLLRSGAGDTELEEALRDYERMRYDHWNETQRLREEASSMLSLRQRCEYTVFEERFRAEIRSMIEDVRRERGIQGEGRMDESPGQGSGSRQGERPEGSGRGRR